MSPDSSRPTGTAIIGAGVAGSSAARVLADRGREVTVFEKSRGPGGRASRRRLDEFQFDHGAQYFTARDPAFARQVDSWREAGVVEEWNGRVVSFGPEPNGPEDEVVRYVGVPGMSSVCRHLARDCPVQYGHRLESARRGDGGWLLQFHDGTTAGPFDDLLVTAPAPQAAALLAPICPALAEQAAAARLQPCWATMLAFERRIEVEFDAAFVHEPGPMRWLARNSSKPGRPAAETWVIHAGPDWTVEHLEQPAPWIAGQMAAAFVALVEDDARPLVSAAHRWRYALVDRPLSVPCLFDAGRRVAAAGDWCLGPRIEAAFQSGAAAAARILGRADNAAG